MNINSFRKLTIDLWFCTIRFRVCFDYECMEFFLFSALLVADIVNNALSFSVLGTEEQSSYFRLIHIFRWIESLLNPQWKYGTIRDLARMKLLDS